MTIRPTVIASCLATALLASMAGGQIQAEHRGQAAVQGEVVAVARANFDIRTDDAQAANRIAMQLASPAQAIRLDAAIRLENSIPGARVDFDPTLGGPKFVRSTSTLLTPPTNGRMTQAQVVRTFVASHADLFAITDAQIDSAIVSRDSSSSNSGARTMWWTQRVEGLEIFNAQLRGNVTADGRLISVSSGMLAEPVGGWRIDDVTISAGEALKIAAGHVGAELANVPAIISAGDGVDRAHRFVQSAELANEPYSRLMLFPVAMDDLRPAWRVVVGAAGESDIYLVFIDAATGELLWRYSLTHDIAEDATYNVYIDPVSLRPLDSPAPMAPAPSTPDGSQAPDAVRTSVTLGAIDLFASPDGWIPVGATDTQGNNVDAHTDQNADDFPDVPRPSAGDRNFDFPINFASGPVSYEEASVVQLFYTSNWFHDITHALGFDETSANFQIDNFGRGGVGGDSVLAQSQDGAGVNNANFTVDPTDGGIGKMQMFIFNGANPDRDGSFDAQVVVHELAHGLSNRLHGGIFTQESAGMGEGWSDFFGFAMLLDPATDPNGPYATGGWLTLDMDPGYDTNYYFGIRRYPYSTDFAVNPLTFADIDPATYGVDAPAPPRSPRSSLNPELAENANRVHFIGEIWCNTLMQARANLMAKHGAVAGNDLMLQLVIDGMKFSPSSPSLIQARDGIMLADMALTGGANICDLWDAFALRGFGASASTGDGASATGLTEAFDAPLNLDYQTPSGVPDQVAPMMAVSFPVEIDAICGDPLDAASAMLLTSINGAPFTSVPLMETAPGMYDVVLPAIDCDEELTWYLSADTMMGDTTTHPANAPTNTFTTIAFTGEVVVVDDDLEMNNGWVVGAFDDTATTGIWERVDPVGTISQPEDDASADGTLCFITGNASPGSGAGTNDIDGGVTTLMSPALDCTGGDAYITYTRWYSNNMGASPNADSMPVDISDDDGANWTQVELVTQNANAWVPVTIRVSDFVTPTNQVRLRFRPSDLDDGSLVEAGVDELLVTILDCAATGLVGDLNGDGVVDTADLGILLAAFGSNDAGADLNNDGVVDTADLGILLAAFGSML